MYFGKMVRNEETEKRDKEFEENEANEFRCWKIFSNRKMWRRNLKTVYWRECCSRKRSLYNAVANVRCLNVTSTKKIDWCCDIKQIHTREEELE